jgi:hypothetical protein
LIIVGRKPVESRTWSTSYRGPVLIHASARRDPISDEEVERRFGARPPADQPLGGVIGVVDVIDCVRGHPSPWAMGDWNFVLANALLPGKAR